MKSLYFELALLCLIRSVGFINWLISSRDNRLWQRSGQRCRRQSDWPHCFGFGCSSHLYWNPAIDLYELSGKCVLPNRFCKSGQLYQLSFLPFYNDIHVCTYTLLNDLWWHQRSPSWCYQLATVVGPIFPFPVFGTYIWMWVAAGWTSWHKCRCKCGWVYGVYLHVSLHKC